MISCVIRVIDSFFCIIRIPFFYFLSHDFCHLTGNVSRPLVFLRPLFRTPFLRLLNVFLLFTIFQMITSRFYLLVSLFFSYMDHNKGDDLFIYLNIVVINRV